MATAIIAALAALGGVLIGKFFDRKAEATRWRREQSAVAFVNLVGESSDYVADMHLPDNELVAGRRERQVRINRAIAGVDLLGSEAVRSSTMKLRDSLSAMHDSRWKAIGSELAVWLRTEMPGLLQNSRTATGAFVEVARKELS